MDVIFLAFANDDNQPLSSLKDEYDGIYKTLSPNHLKQHYLLHRDTEASIESISHYLVQFRNHIRLFLYSGHAGEHRLVLDKGDARAEGIAQLLSQCPKLKLVFLNGCSTKGQVNALLEKGIPAVLATSAPIDDKIASQFSNQFFHALNNQASIEEAFELAKGELQSRKDIQAKLTHELPVWGEDEKEQTLWGLYAHPDGLKALSWKLPTLSIVAKRTHFEPNQLLFDSLVKALAPFHGSIQKILDDEAMGAPASDGKKMNAIIPALPYLISEQLAKLLALPTPGTENMTFYHELGTDRLNQIVITYNRLMELIAFTMLAQVWELALTKENIQLPEDAKLEFRRFFELNGSERKTYNLGKLIEKIRLVLDQNDQAYFMDELGPLALTFKDEDLSNILIFLEHLKQKIYEKDLEEMEAMELCVIAEEKLSILIQHLGFLTNYELTSVKAIEVMKYRHFTSPKFRHVVVNLVKEGAAAPFEDLEIRDKILDSNSVIMQSKEEEKAKFLNLSPFIIDENAYDKKAKDSKLYFFDHMDEDTGAYIYKHSYKPRDPKLIIQEQPQFRMLVAQFDAFFKAIN